MCTLTVNTHAVLYYIRIYIHILYACSEPTSRIDILCAKHYVHRIHAYSRKLCCCM